MSSQWQRILPAPCLFPFIPLSSPRLCPQAFEQILNRGGRCSRSAAHLSAFVDASLGGRSSTHALSDRDLDAALESAVALFRCLEDKDVFEAFYRDHFAKRLLAGRVEEDAEYAMLGRLKVRRWGGVSSMPCWGG